MSCTVGSAECGKRHLVPKLQSNLEVTKHFNIFKEKRRRILVSLNRWYCSHIHSDNTNMGIKLVLSFPVLVDVWHGLSDTSTTDRTQRSYWCNWTKVDVIVVKSTQNWKSPRPPSAQNICFRIVKKICICRFFPPAAPRVETAFHSKFSQGFCMSCELWHVIENNLIVSVVASERSPTAAEDGSVQSWWGNVDPRCSSVVGFLLHQN